MSLLMEPCLLAAAREQSAYAVGWFSLAMVNAGIAQGKNRSGLIWFLLSLPLGPIATFVLISFFPKRYRQELP